MVQHAVCKAGGGDGAPLGVVDHKAVAAALGRGAIQNALRQVVEVGIQRDHKLGHGGPVVLAPRSLVHRQQQVAARGNVL